MEAGRHLVDCSSHPVQWREKQRAGERNWEGSLWAQGPKCPEGLEAGLALFSGLEAGFVLFSGLEAGLVLFSGLEAGLVLLSGLEAGLVLFSSL